MNTPIRFRSMGDEDLEFSYRVYADTRAEEMAQVPWSDGEKEKFLRMQFQAQHAHYQKHYSGASFDIILLGEEPVGRLFVHRGEEEICIVDIALLREHRGRGLGGKIMGDLLQEARKAEKPVRIHVLNNNRALHLYNRLGFQKVDDTGVYSLMIWRAEKHRPGTGPFNSSTGRSPPGQ